MFAKTIIDSDAFLDMSLTTQALYFHLSMRADDEGFINNPKKIQRMIGASEDDLKLLIAKNFIIPFESGIVVIKHWKIHNYLRSDRFKPTVYQEEKAMLCEKENKAYTLDKDGIPLGIPNVDQRETQYRIGKDRKEIDKNIICLEETSSNNDRLQIYKDIIDYLNLKTGSKYKPTSKATKEHINARLKEGFTLEDFKTVIDNKTEEWKGTDFEQYLRPLTLFGTKFESYLNTKPKKKASDPTYTFEGMDDLDEFF